MRKLIVQQYMTLNGYGAEEDGGMSFVASEPFGKSDDKVRNDALGFIEGIDTMIIGRNTYEMFKDYWPNTTEEGEFADKLNMLKKYVGSTTLSKAPWGTYEPAEITEDAVRTVQELKQQDGKDIVLWGSFSLMNAMFEASMVDEVQLRVCPATRGTGTRIFDRTHELKLKKCESFENGIVMLCYDVVH